ncbi:MAG: DUF2894 domain-containing protein [Ideonella sp.]
MSPARPASEGLNAQSQDEQPEERIAGLRERGAHHADPARFRYLEALARRAQAHQGAVRQALDARLVLCVAAYLATHENSDTGSGPPGTGLESHRQRGPLGQLVDYIDQQASTPDAGPPSAGAALPDLKTLRQFRSTWTSLSVDRQLSRSKEQVPDNPGPLNSHLLVLRSLKLMQQVSPAYLTRFMSHVEGLLWLDQVSFGGLPTTGKTVLRQSEKKRKPNRGKTGQERR